MTQSGPAMAKPIVWRPTCSITRCSRLWNWRATTMSVGKKNSSLTSKRRTPQDPRRPSKPTHLRSQTPEGVEQELYALSLGHFVVRALMLEAAQRENLDVDRLSFTGCLQILQARLPECDSTTPQRLDQWYDLLLAELVQERVEPRRNRLNPRVVKRKMSKFAKKRPEHRGRPPLKKTFAETVVIT